MVRKLLVAALLLVPLAARGDSKPAPRADKVAPVKAAASPPAPAVPKTAGQLHVDDCAKARKDNRTCVLDMGGENINGEAASGDGMQGTGIVFNPQSSLVRLRRDFIPEIIKSAEAM